MADERVEMERVDGSVVQSRRDFLTTLGVAGGVLMGGAAWAQPPQRPVGIRTVRPQPTGRATDSLTLQAPLQVQRATRNGQEDEIAPLRASGG